jgi:hypothetical protein
MHPIELLGDMGHLKSHFGQSKMVLVSMQEWCMACAKRTVGSEVILDTPDGTPI